MFRQVAVPLREQNVFIPLLPGLVMTHSDVNFITDKCTDSRGIPRTLYDDRVSEDPYATERVLDIRRR